MRAVTLPRFGGSELMEVKEIERPEPGRGEVLVRVMAAGTNPIDAKIRANGTWAGLELPVVLGYDAAGIVEAVGPEVRDLAEGDEVYYTPPIQGNSRGTYAEFNAVPAAMVAKKPAGVSFTDAAAIPLAGGTAWEAVIRRIAVRAGETILVHGGAGGVGSFAIQFARVAGARVLATSSTANLPFLRELGADVAIDYTMEDAAEVAREETGGIGADAVFDIQGQEVVSRSLQALRPAGRIACILPPEGDLTLLYQRNLTLHGVFLTRERKRLEEMRPLFERGLVHSAVTQVLPFGQASKAHARFEAGHGRGKVVLDPALAEPDFQPTRME